MPLPFSSDHSRGRSAACDRLAAVARQGQGASYKDDLLGAHEALSRHLTGYFVNRQVHTNDTTDGGHETAVVVVRDALSDAWRCWRSTQDNHHGAPPPMPSRAAERRLGKPTLHKNGIYCTTYEFVNVQWIETNKKASSASRHYTGHRERAVASTVGRMYTLFLAHQYARIDVDTKLPEK
ncbi:hypothetical protein J6590_059277 [Homalodisca vitripennis]|nr:hypothetical protein J6590_059277 [Homalodisca vitripennis]